MKQLQLSSPSFIQLEQDYALWLDTLGYAASSRHYLPLHVREFLHYLESRGMDAPEQMQGKQVNAFFTCLHQRGHQRKIGQPLSHAYLNKYLQALKLLSRYVRQTGQSTFTVQKQSIQAESSLPYVLSQKEIQALYAVCEQDLLGLRDRAMLSLFYGCGLRRSEGVALDIGDFLLPQGLLYVRKGKNYTERYLPLSTQVQEDVQAWLTEARPFFYHAAHQKAFFISKQGKRAQGQSLNLRLQTLLVRAGITAEVSLHGLRHAIASHLLENEMPLQDIACFLGHKSLESTQIYTRSVETRIINGSL